MLKNHLVTTIRKEMVPKNQKKIRDEPTDRNGRKKKKRTRDQLVPVCVWAPRRTRMGRVSGKKKSWGARTRGGAISQEKKKVV